MKETFLKGYWAEEDLWIYQHYEDQYTIRQIFIYPTKSLFLSLDNPIQGNDFLCDQPLEIIDTSMVEFIDKDEFEKVWNKREL